MAILIDTSSFERVLNEAVLRSHRDMPDVINWHAIAVITKAAKLTPKADKASIPYKLYSEVSNKSGKPTPLIYLLINARRKSPKGLNNDQMRVAAAKLIRARVASIGYTAYAGWDNALRSMGGKGFGSKRKGFSSSAAARGMGSKASVGNLSAMFTNNTPWIERIGVKALQDALDAEEANMVRHLESKIGEHFQAASR